MVRSDFYVYHLIDPRCGSVFYVGKGRGNRAYLHARLGKAASCNFVKVARIKEIQAAGLKVVEKIVESGLTEPEAFRIEKQMISEMKDGLTNISGGTVTANQSLLAKAKDMRSRIKPYDVWVRTCGAENVDSTVRMYGDLKAYYESFVGDLDKVIRSVEAVA